MAVHYYQELLNYCARSLRSREAAADVVQEAYARFLALSGAGEVVRDARALLYRVARNVLTDQHRRDSHRQHEDLHNLSEIDEPQAPRCLQPEEVYAFTQYATAMIDAIEGLPTRCREAFVLCRFEGLSQQEVADRMGISRNMVVQHIVRGMLVCKACDERFRTRV